MSTLFRILTALTLSLAAAVSTAGEVSNPQMAIVRIKVDGSGVSLLDVKVADGRLKRPRTLDAHQGELRFDVVGSDGRVSYSGTVDDPMRVELEYFNEDGSIGRIVETKESGTAYLRIPFDGTASEIRVGRMVTAEEGSVSVLKAQPLGRIHVEAEVADE